jgi:2,5-diamino-6-(ribosylamino)-4(3H)-pyrimidinone 5'-phosphate reductase
MTAETAELERPRVVVSVGTSIDGKVGLRRDSILMDEETGRLWQSAQPPGSPELTAARKLQLDELFQPQVYLEGSNSFVIDSAGPLTNLPTDFGEPLDVLYTDFLPEEVLNRPGHEKWLAAVDSRGRVHWDVKSGGEFDVLVLAARATPAPYLAYLRRERVPYLVVGEERVDLAVALRRMREQLGVTRVLSTAGGGINGALLRAGLIDEIHVVIGPFAVGGLTTPTLFDGPELGPGEAPTPLKLLSTHVESNGMLWLRYEVLRA